MIFSSSVNASQFLNAFPFIA